MRRIGHWMLVVLAVALLALAGCAGLAPAKEQPSTAPISAPSYPADSSLAVPREQALNYLARHIEEYDSFILGPAAAASYTPQALERYLGGSFYNLFHYGVDLEYDRALAASLLEVRPVKHILLVLGPGAQDSQALSHVLGDLDPATGCHDTESLDALAIGSLSAYLQENPWTGQSGQGDFAPDPEGWAAQVEAIAALCREAGTQLTVLLSPLYQAQLESWDPESADQLIAALCREVPLWDFSACPLSYDPRYFYDGLLLRPDAVRLVLDRIFTGEDASGGALGRLCQDGNSLTPSRQVRQISARALEGQTHTARIPILLYHHLDPDKEESATVLHPDTFRRHMQLLYDNGYHPVTFQELIGFVERGEPLPERPVVITFDDGYQSNYDYAFPVLQEYGFPATIFLIGSSIGHERFYKDTQHTLTPHFGQEEIDEMLASGLIFLESHTYDMHQWAPFEPEGAVVRSNMLPLDGESERAYADAVRRDVARQREVFQTWNIPESRVLSFPIGKRVALTNEVLRECGFLVTVTTDSSRENILVQGLSQSLLDLGRLTVGGSTTDEALLAYLSPSQPDPTS